MIAAAILSGWLLGLLAYGLWCLPPWSMPEVEPDRVVDVEELLARLDWDWPGRDVA